MPFPDDFYEYLDNNTLIEIKGGLERETFLEIWMVTVDSRVFARSWKKSKISWFTEFLKTGVGQVKYGEKVLTIHGKKPEPEQELTRRINSAYLKRYNQEENKPYAIGITQPEYEEYTMEFFYPGAEGI